MFLMVSFCWALLLVHFLPCSLLLTSSAVAWVSPQATVPSEVLPALAWESGSSTGHSPFGRVPAPACVPPWEALTSRVALALAWAASFQQSRSSHLSSNVPFHVSCFCVTPLMSFLSCLLCPHMCTHTPRSVSVFRSLSQVNY